MLFYLSLWFLFLCVTFLSLFLAALHSQHNDDEQETTAASEHHLLTHSLLHTIEKAKAQSHPLPATPTSFSSPETIELTRELTYSRTQTEQISKEMWGFETEITSTDCSANFFRQR